MATYLELFALASDSDLQDKAAVAVAKKAQAILDSTTPTQTKIDWAVEALDNPRGRAERLLNYVLAANSELTVAQIKAASDSAIQNNIDNAVDAITGA